MRIERTVGLSNKITAGPWPTSARSSRAAAARPKVGRASGELVAESDALEQRFSISGCCVTRLTEHLARCFADILQHVHVREQMKLLKNHPHFAANVFEQVRRVAFRVGGRKLIIADVDRAGLKRLKTIEAAQKRALAATGRSDDRGHFAELHGERNAAAGLRAGRVVCGDW